LVYNTAKVASFQGFLVNGGHELGTNSGAGAATAPQMLDIAL
jgi:hypothetical protein